MLCTLQREVVSRVKGRNKISLGFTFPEMATTFFTGGCFLLLNRLGPSYFLAISFIHHPHHHLSVYWSDKEEKTESLWQIENSQYLKKKHKNREFPVGIHPSAHPQTLPHLTRIPTPSPYPHLPGKINGSHLVLSFVKLLLAIPHSFFFFRETSAQPIP